MPSVCEDAHPQLYGRFSRYQFDEASGNLATEELGAFEPSIAIEGSAFAGILFVAQARFLAPLWNSPGFPDT